MMHLFHTWIYPEGEFNKDSVRPHFPPNKRYCKICPRVEMRCRTNSHSGGDGHQEIQIWVRIEDRDATETKPNN